VRGRAGSWALALGAAVAVSACGSSAGSPAPATSPGAASSLRLGYFATVTHAGPLIGVEKGFYASALGSTALKTQIFHAGGTAIQALLSGAVDAAYVGPSPAINGFVKSGGRALRIVAGATANGASLVVRAGITSAAQLRGTTLADPQTGATQDVALRTYLAAQGFREDRQGGGDVTIVAQDNAATLAAFRQGRVDGAWVPEPWASRLVVEGGAHELVDEASQWPGGQFVTTQLVVATSYLAAHPTTVANLLRGQITTQEWIAAHGQDAQAAASTALARLTGTTLAPAVLAGALARVHVTEDPLAATLKTSAEHAVATGLLPAADITGIYDLTLLRQVLGRDVSDAGLGAAR